MGTCDLVVGGETFSRKSARKNKLNYLLLCVNARKTDLIMVCFGISASLLPTFPIFLGNPKIHNLLLTEIKVFSAGRLVCRGICGGGHVGVGGHV